MFWSVSRGSRESGDVDARVCKASGRHGRTAKYSTHKLSTYAQINDVENVMFF